MLKNSNIALRRAEEAIESENIGYKKATYLGVGLKTLYFVAMSVVGGLLGIYLFTLYPEGVVGMLCGSGILCFITALIAMRKSNLSFAFGTAYSIMEGMLIGVVSLLMEAIIPGVVITAMVSTLAIVTTIAVLFLSGLVKVNSKFFRFLFIFVAAYLISMLVMWILSRAGIVDMENNKVILLVGFITVLIASLFLFSDFEYAYRIVSSEAPREYEWMVSFGIAYTVIWLYYEILRIVYIFIGSRRG